MDNINDIGLSGDNSKKEQQYNLGNANNNVNKKLNYKKLNEIEYNHNYGNSELNLGNNKNINIRSNSHTNNEYNKYNIKPIVLKTEKFQQGNNNYNLYKNNNHTIKFNNIIKNNNYTINKNKINVLKKNDNNYPNLNNITLSKLKQTKKSDEVKIKNPMPTLGHIHTKHIEENNFVKQRRFITNDNIKRKTNLSEHKKLSNGNYRIELTLANKNYAIGNKLNNLYNKNADI